MVRQKGLSQLYCFQTRALCRLLVLGVLIGGASCLSNNDDDDKDVGIGPADVNTSIPDTTQSKVDVEPADAPLTCSDAEIMLGNSCATCPLPEFTCDSLDVEASEIDGLSVILRFTKPGLVAARGMFKMSTSLGTVETGRYFFLEGSVLQDGSIAFDLSGEVEPNYEFLGLEDLRLTDACGEEWRFVPRWTWERFGEVLSQECSAYTPPP